MRRNRVTKNNSKKRKALTKIFKRLFTILLLLCLSTFFYKFYYSNISKNGNNINSSNKIKKETNIKNTNINSSISNNTSDNNNKPSSQNKNTDSYKSATNKGKNKNEDTYTEVLMSFAGDCTLGSDPNFSYTNSLPYVFKKNNNDLNYFFKNVYDIFKNDDFTVVNLETTFTNSDKRAPDKDFTFKGNPEYAKSLKVSSIEAVNLSNNHIYDFLQKGFNDTIKALKDSKVSYFGEGNKLNVNINNKKFTFLGYQGWSYTKNFTEKFKKNIDSAKQNGNIVIVTFHWGLEGEYSPYSVQKNLAHFAIDNGADLIIGHHPHVVQSIEKYKNKIICYSLGNFCFGGNFNPKDKDTFIFQIKFKFKNNEMYSYDTKIIPCSISSKSYINDYCPTPLKGNEGKRVLNKIQNLSPTFKDNVKNVFINNSLSTEK